MNEQKSRFIKFLSEKQFAYLISIMKSEIKVNVKKTIYSIPFREYLNSLVISNNSEVRNELKNINMKVGTLRRQVTKIKKRISVLR